MTKLQQLLKEQEDWLNKEFHCITSECDNNGTIPVRVSDDDWEPQQCEYCYKVRFPLQKFIKEHNAKIIKAVCEEMTLEYKSNNFIISNREKAKELESEVKI